MQILDQQVLASVNERDDIQPLADEASRRLSVVLPVPGAFPCLFFLKLDTLPGKEYTQ